MTKRTFLKTIAFVCGLYFVLEFLLPEKLGGDFDGFDVHSPTSAGIPGGPVFYVGQYDQRKAGVGRLVQDAEVGWRRSPDVPVLQRALFEPAEKCGMRQLAAVADDTGIDLFYLGIDTQQHATLCHARGDTEGLAWRRSGPVRFEVGGRTEPTVSEPNGRLPGTIEAFAVAAAPDRSRRVLLLLQRPGAGHEVWEARGGSSDATRLRLALQPLMENAELPAGLAAFDAIRDPGGDAWSLFFVQAKGGTNLLVSADGSVVGRPFALPLAGTVTGLRMLDAEHAVAACRPTGEDGATHAAIFLTSPRLAKTVATVGRAARPTYLSNAILPVGNALQIIGAFAVFVALINLTLFHGKRIAQRQPRRVNSIIFFVFLVAMGLCTFLGKSEAATGTVWRQGYDMLFEAIVRPLGTAVFSMITFYMISAAYRSFRIRSVEAALLMLSACVVMIGQMPVGAWLGALLPDSLAFLRLPWLAEKLLTVVNACAYRGVLIGLVVGGLSISLRIWLGLDNSVYAGLERKD